MFGESDSSRGEEIIFLGKAVKFRGIFSKLCIKINKNFKILGKIRGKCNFFEITLNFRMGNFNLMGNIRNIIFTGYNVGEGRKSFKKFVDIRNVKFKK